MKYILIIGLPIFCTYMLSMNNDIFILKRIELSDPCLNHLRMLVFTERTPLSNEDMKQYIISLEDPERIARFKNKMKIKERSFLTKDMLKNLFCFSNLVSLALNNVELYNFAAIKALKNLTALQCKHLCKLDSFKGLNKINGLKAIKITFCDKIRIIKEGAIPKNVTHVNISHSGLESLKCFRHLISLKILILKHNKLEGIERDCIPQTVEKLDVSHNNITDIFGLRFYHGLTTVKCKKNKIEDFTSLYFLIKEGSLEKFTIAHNLFSIETLNKFFKHLEGYVTCDNVLLSRKKVVFLFAEEILNMTRKREEKLQKKRKKMEKETKKLKTIEKSINNTLDSLSKGEISISPLN